MQWLSYRDVVETLNHLGGAYWSFATAMLVQVGLLVAVIACLDVIWLRRTRAAVRYGIWSLVLVKLMLPVWLQGPLSFTGLLDAIPPNTRLVEMRTLGAAASSGPRLMSQNNEPGSFHSTRTEVSSPSTAVAGSSAVSTPVDVSRGLGSLNWQSWLFLVWIAGQALLFSYFVRRVMAVRALVRGASPAPQPLQSMVWKCQQLLGMEKRSIKLCFSDQLSTPAICGFWRPTILLPRALANQLDEEQLRLVFVHELTHWKRFDLQVNCLQTLLAIAYFYNPLVWIGNTILRRLREQVVDEAVLVTSRSTAERYSLTLLALVEMSRPSPDLALRMVGVVESRHALSERIRRILAQPNPGRARLGLSGLALVVLVGVALLPLAGRMTFAIAGEQQTSGERKDDGAQKSTTSKGQDGTQAQNSDAVSPKNVPPDEMTGIVQDENGKPLVGVNVDAWHWYPGNETTTDENGRFQLKGFDPKRKVEVLISKDGYCPQHFPQRPLGVTNWVVILGSKTYFEGTVLGTDGKPVANAGIRASFGPVQADGVQITEVTTEGKSREDGTFRLYVAPGTYDIQMSGGQRGVFRQSGVAIKPDEAKRLPAQLQPGVRFEARIVDSVTSEPVEGFILWQWRPPKLFARSGVDGRIVFDGLIPGQTEFNCGGGEEVVHESGARFYHHGPFGRWWSVEATNEWQRPSIDDKKSVWQRNFDDLGFDLKVGMQPVTIVVEKGVLVTGRVTDPKGAPVAGATVAPARTGSGNSLTGDTRYSVRSEKDGTYRVVLPASNKASYNLVVHDGDYQEWRNWANGVSEPLQTQPGQKIEGFNLQLSEPATIRGRVIIEGRAASRRDVRTHAFDKRENRYYDPTTETKTDGSFELKFVRPGKHYLQVEPFWLSAEDAPQGSKIVEVKAGEVVEGIELVAVPK